MRSLDEHGKTVPVSSRKSRSTRRSRFVLGQARGTRVLSNTGNLAAVMKTMGHRDVKTAMKYQHPELEIVRAALSQASEPVMQTSA